MNHCGDCRFFDPLIGRDDFGHCASPTMVYLNAYRPPTGVPTDRLVYRDGDGFDAPPFVGAGYGCVHWESRSDSATERSEGA